MPEFYPEINQIKPSDDLLRALHKFADMAYDPSVVTNLFPEGLRILPSDDEERTLKKLELLGP